MSDSQIYHQQPSEETDLAAAIAVMNFKPRSVRRPSPETESRICSHGKEADECLECHADSAGQYADLPTLQPGA